MYNPNSFPDPSLIPANGIELEVFELGKENAGNPIILCHGWPELAFSWRYQLKALADAGFHVIVPNQRGFGNSSNPGDVAAYDIQHLTGDLTALLDHFGYEQAVFVGHDWGSMVVWGMALVHPDRVEKIVNLSLPYQVRGDKPWIEFMEELFGADNYFVHFNRKPGVADKILDQNTQQFLHNLYRKNFPAVPPEPGMIMINLAQATSALGEPLMSEAELSVFTTTFERTGFSGGINWYRNLDRNWHILGSVDPIITKPALMIYGKQDAIPAFEGLCEYVPNVTITT